MVETPLDAWCNTVALDCLADRLPRITGFDPPANLGLDRAEAKRDAAEARYRKALAQWEEG